MDGASGSARQSAARVRRRATLVWLRGGGGRGAPLIGAEEAGDGGELDDLRRRCQDGQVHISRNDAVHRGGGQMRGGGRESAARHAARVRSVVDRVQAVLEGEEREEQ